MSWPVRGSGSNTLSGLTLSRTHTRAMFGASNIKGTNAPLAGTGFGSTNTASFKIDAECDFDSVQLIIGSYENTGNPLAGIKAIVAATETAAVDTADNTFRPIVGGTKFNTIRNSTDLYGWSSVTWSFNSVWDGTDNAPTVTNLAHAATGTLPLALSDSSVAQRPLDGPTTWSRGGSATLPSFLVSDWTPCSSVPRADGGTRPLALIRIYMPGDATHTWSYALFPADTVNTPPNGSFQLTAFQQAAYRNRIMQGAYSFSDNIAVLNDSFAFSSVGTQKLPWVWARFRSRNGGITVMYIGDSITEDTYVSDTISSFGHRASCDVSTTSRPVYAINAGISGQTTQTYWKQARNLLTVMKPDVMVYCPFSQNDLPITRRTSEDELARTMDVLDYAANNKIPAIVWTAGPCESFNLTQETERRYMNTQILRLFSAPTNGAQSLDFNALVSQGLPLPTIDLWKPDEGGNTYKANATHPSEWAFDTKMAPLMAGALRAILG